MLDPDHYGDPAIRQRFYRRGGTLVADWYFVGQNTADGEDFLDRMNDATASGEDTVQLDHDQPVTTQDADGNTIHAQPCPVLIGPIQDLLFAIGDPHRPGHLYYPIPGEPDHWPPNNFVEVCSPSEQLMNGGIYAGQAFVFSRERLYYLYPNLTNNGTVSTAPTGCKKGIVARWFMTVGRGGIYFGNATGIFRTQGDDPTLLSRVLNPLFRGQTTNGYQWIDFSQEDALRLELFQHELWFQYRTSRATGRSDLLAARRNRDAYDFARPLSVVLRNRPPTTRRSSWARGGTATRTPAHRRRRLDPVALPDRRDGLRAPRETKLFGDIIVDVDPGDAEMTMQARINNDDVVGRRLRSPRRPAGTATS
jgi:hypothetical protein